MDSRMWKPMYHIPPPPPIPNVRNNPNDFRQDSTVCKVCGRHLFRTEAVRCHGPCNGEFHAECSARHDWTCGKCKKENSIAKEDFDKLSSAVDDINKNLVKTDAKIAGLRVETAAGKISDNIELSELRTEMRNLHIRFDFMEKQMNSLKAVMSTSVTELKTTISGLESKILVLTARQIKFDQIDISGVQDTLKNASHLIVTEMTRTLDRLLEEKTQFEAHHPSPPQHQNEQQGTSKSNAESRSATSLPQEKMQMLQTHNRALFKKQQQQQQRAGKIGYNKCKPDEKSLEPSQQHQKTSRLQQLAVQFQLQ